MENTGKAALKYCYSCMAQLASGQPVCPVCGRDNSIFVNPGTALPEGTILAGKYLIGRILGQGGFGITYLGYDPALKVRLAIKEYFPAGIAIRTADSVRVTTVSDPAKAEGFRRGCDEFQAEAQRLAQIDSPNIVKVRDYFRENGTSYIVMNYLDGNSLSEETIVCRGRIPWQRVSALFKPLIPEIDKLHARHMIHRDIKPDNLRVVKDPDGTERLVLLDFGSARNFVSSEITQTYTAMFTKGYAPYEQYMTRARQGPYTDVYALCATMYTVITGVIPPAATDLMAGEADVLPVRSFGIPVPENVDRAILHGLAVRRSVRTQTMRDLYRELYEDLQEPVSREPGKNQTVFPVRQVVPLQGELPPVQEDKPQLDPLNQENTQIPAGEAQDPAPQAADPAEAKTEDGNNADTRNKALPLLIILLLVLAGGVFYALYQRTQINIRLAVATSAAETQFFFDATLTKAAEPTPTPTPTQTPTQTPTYTPTPEVQVGSFITMGHYEQDDNPNNGEEAIEWQVLAVENGLALVISKYGLDAKPYNEKWTSVTWETCSLRAWLNVEFYNSVFSEEEKGRIQWVWLNNPDNVQYGTKGGNDTTDRIFLLSIYEVGQYFKNGEERQCGATIYARNNGAYTVEKYGALATWWLRSPGESDRKAICVDKSGSVYDYGFVDSKGNVVRPAFWLIL